jgi:hypothetical protein
MSPLFFFPTVFYLFYRQNNWPMFNTEKRTVVAIEEGCFIAVAVVVAAVAADFAWDHFVFVTGANTKPHWQKMSTKKLLRKKNNLYEKSFCN